MQKGQRAAVPVVHTVELLDWATGGPMPRRSLAFDRRTQYPALEPLIQEIEQ